MPKNSSVNGKKLRMTAAAILCIIMGVMIALSISAKRSLRASELATIELYYMNQDSSGMRSETKHIAKGTEQEMVNAVLNYLKTGSKKEGFIASIPFDVKFLNATISDGLVTVDASEDYEKLSPGAEIICRSSIVWTITSLPFVNSVAMTIEGEPLLKTDGTEIGNMNRDNVIIDTIVSPETKRYDEFELYFSNDDSSALVSEKREIEVSQNQPKERSIVEQLIAGPKDKAYHGTIPTDTKLRDITTTDDGTCYVNFSAEFVNKKSAGSETLTIYSVVNSLTGLEYVDKVQFLIEGEKVEKYRDSIDISKPLGARSSLVK